MEFQSVEAETMGQKAGFRSTSYAGEDRQLSILVGQSGWAKSRGTGAATLIQLLQASSQ